MLVPFSKFSCLLQGMDRYFEEMCGSSQPQTFVYWVFNYRKNEIKWVKNMTPGMVPLYALTMPWWKFEKVWLMSSCTPFINRTITKEVPCFREGNHQDWRGIQIFFVFFPGVFFLRRTYTLQITVFKFCIFPGSFTIFRGLCAFSRHLAHINPIQLHVHGCDVRDVDCCLIAMHPMVHTRDPRAGVPADHNATHNRLSTHYFRKRRRRTVCDNERAKL